MKTDRSSKYLRIARDVSIPASEAWLFRNEKAINSVRRGLEETATGKTKSGRSFAQFVEEVE